jgi:hypothetical protein
MRAPLLRLAIGIPIALLASVVLLVSLLILSRLPVPQQTGRLPN